MCSQGAVCDLPTVSRSHVSLADTSLARLNITPLRSILSFNMPLYSSPIAHTSSELHATRLSRLTSTPTRVRTKSSTRITSDRAGLFRAEVPSGASTGVHEAVELRDGGKDYVGKGELSDLLLACAQTQVSPRPLPTSTTSSLRP